MSAPAKSNGDAPAAAAATPVVEIAKLPGGKPDADAHKKAMDDLKKEIDDVTANVNNLRSLLSGSGPSKDTPQGKRSAALRAELNELRNKQAGSKGARGKVLDEIKALQDGVGKKIKDLNAAKSKANFRSVSEVEAQIARLEAQVESGSMKLVDERRALGEISQLKKSRRVVEGFEVQQKAIDADRTKLDSLRATLDDPESKALSKRYDEIKAELDAIQKEVEKTSGSRQKLIEQREAASKKLDDLYATRRGRYAAFRTANEAYNAKVSAEREKRLAAQREEKKAYEDAKRKENEKAMREEAALPAFAKEIEDCDVLIAYFSGKGGVASQSSAATTASNGNGVVGGKKLELRKVEEDESFKGMVVKRKGEDEDDSYFVGGGKGKGKKGGNKSNGKEAAASSPAGDASGSLHVPLGTLSALLSLSIPPPSSASDVQRVVDNLKLKRAYFVSNQERQTKLNVEKVEKLLAKSGISEGGKAEEGKEGSEKVKEVEGDKAE